MAGAEPILAFEPLPHRREAAAALGADQVVDPAELGPELEMLPDLVGYGVDVAFEIAGGDAGVGLAMHATRPGGRVTLGGIPDDAHIGFGASLARRKGLTIAMVRRMNEVYERAISLVARGQVDTASLVTDSFGLDDTADAFATATKRAGLKVVVEPHADPPGGTAR